MRLAVQAAWTCEAQQAVYSCVFVLLFVRPACSALMFFGLCWARPN